MQYFPNGAVITDQFAVRQLDIFVARHGDQC